MLQGSQLLSTVELFFLILWSKTALNQNPKQKPTRNPAFPSPQSTISSRLRLPHSLSNPYKRSSTSPILTPFLPPVFYPIASLLCGSACFGPAPVSFPVKASTDAGWDPAVSTLSSTAWHLEMAAAHSAKLPPFSFSSVAAYEDAYSIVFLSLDLFLSLTYF